MLHAKRYEQFACSAFGFAQGHAINVNWRKPHVFDHRQVLKEMMELEHHPDLAAECVKYDRCVALACAEDQLFDLNASGLKDLKARDRAQNRGLACSGRPHQRHEFPVSNVEGYIRKHTARATAKLDLPQTERCAGHAVAAFQRRSSRRASAASGSDIAR
jgi:hypothetical protein